jgi:hypothetical protein
MSPTNVTGCTQPVVHGAFPYEIYILTLSNNIIVGYYCFDLSEPKNSTTCY